jgi:hypothetical protein
MTSSKGIFYRVSDASGREAIGRTAIDAMRNLCALAGRDTLDRDYRAEMRGAWVSLPMPSARCDEAAHFRAGG